MALDTSIPVLIIDDYQTMLRIVRNLLRRIGFTDVDEARNGGRRWRSSMSGPTGW
jgi:two-component system chemotaxis response regulator CheY